MTRKSCRVMTCVPVLSPYSLKSRGGSQLIKSDNHYNQLLFGLSVKCTAEHKQLHVLVTLYNRGISICYFLKVKGLINKTRRMKLYKPQIKCSCLSDGCFLYQTVWWLHGCCNNEVARLSLTRLSTKEITGV